MFYAELVDYSGHHNFEIMDKGIFFSIEEFIPYRICGWSGVTEIDRLADEAIAKAEGR